MIISKSLLIYIGLIALAGGYLVQHLRKIMVLKRFAIDHDLKIWLNLIGNHYKIFGVYQNLNIELENDNALWSKASREYPGFFDDSAEIKINAKSQGYINNFAKKSLRDSKELEAELNHKIQKFNLENSTNITS